MNNKNKDQTPFNVWLQTNLDREVKNFLLEYEEVFVKRAFFHYEDEQD